jgi:hypothetical protein
MDRSERVDEPEGLDLTSEMPQVARLSSESNGHPSSRSDGSAQLDSVRVLFRCCRVYWRFPIPDEILNGTRENWFVHCPRCASKVMLP